MVEIVYLMSPEARIIQNETILLPACYVRGGKIVIEGKRYRTAIFIAPEIMYYLIQFGEYETYEDCINELVEHELVHEIMPNWKHECDILTFRF